MASTAEFLRELQAQGLKDVSEEDAVSFRIHGVTPDLVGKVRSLGYANPSADDLVALRIHGISLESIRKANARAGRLLPLEDVVDRSVCGKDENDDDE